MKACQADMKYIKFVFWDVRYFNVSTSAIFRASPDITWTEN
jgi:hypothetical protein